MPLTEHERKTLFLLSDLERLHRLEARDAHAHNDYKQGVYLEDIAMRISNKRRSLFNHFTLKGY